MAFSPMRFNVLELTTGTAAFKYCHESFDSPGKDCINVLLQMSPTGKNSLEFDLITDEAMQSAIDIQSVFLGMFCSTTARHLPHNALQSSVMQKP
jgi:hypothetical protein